MAARGTVVSWGLDIAALQAVATAMLARAVGFRELDGLRLQALAV